MSHWHSESRYLVPESIALLEHLMKTHPALGSLMIVGVFGGVLGVLRRMFGRIASDMILFALIISAIILFSGSALYTLTHLKGFQFGG